MKSTVEFKSIGKYASIIECMEENELLSSNIKQFKLN